MTTSEHSSKPLQATSQQAIVILVGRGLSKYRIAKSLGVAPVSINHWLANTKMSEANAEKMLKVFNIEVTDSFAWSKE